MSVYCMTGFFNLGVIILIKLIPRIYLMMAQSFLQGDLFLVCSRNSSLSSAIFSFLVLYPKGALDDTHD